MYSSFPCSSRCGEGLACSLTCLLPNTQASLLPVASAESLGMDQVYLYLTRGEEHAGQRNKRVAVPAQVSLW